MESESWDNVSHSTMHWGEIADDEWDRPYFRPPTETRRISRLVSSKNKDIVVFHNLDGRKHQESLDVSQELLEYLIPLNEAGDRDRSVFVVSVLFVKELPPPQKVVGRGTRKQNESLSRSKDKRRIADQRRSVLDHTILSCAQCGQHFPFQSVRHSKGKREFKIIVYSTIQDARESFLSYLKDLKKQYSPSNVTFFGPDIEFNQSLAQDSPFSHIICKSLVAPPEYSTLQENYECKDFEQSGTLKYFDDEDDFQNSEYLDSIVSKVIDWIQRSSSLPKTKRKLQNAVSPLLKMKLDSHLVETRIPEIVKRLNPGNCSSCLSLRLQALFPFNSFEEINFTGLLSSTRQEFSNSETEGKKENQKDIVIGKLWKTISGKRKEDRILAFGLDEFTSKLLLRCSSIFLNQKDLPSSKAGLHNAILSSCSSIVEEVDFDTIFSILERKNIVRENPENYELIYVSSQ